MIKDRSDSAARPAIYVVHRDRKCRLCHGQTSGGDVSDVLVDADLLVRGSLIA
jgi:hypothetical protein